MKISDTFIFIAYLLNIFLVIEHAELMAPLQTAPIFQMSDSISASQIIERAEERNRLSSYNRTPGYFWAKRYGTCVWSPSGDVGPCINEAIIAASRSGGGKVVIDAGTFGLSTILQNTASGVTLVGAGVGDPRGVAAPNDFQAVTRLIWKGAQGATMLYIGPSSDAKKSLFSAGSEGIVFDCNNIADVCVKIAQVSHSAFNIGSSEPRLFGIWVTTKTIEDSPGTQDNDFWLQSRSTSDLFSPTGIFLDGNASKCETGRSCWNTSFNRFHRLYAWTGNGDGIVFGDSDNNLIYDVNGYQQPKSGSGTMLVFASSGYVMPNGVQVSGPAYTNRVLHSSAPTRLAGLSTGARVVPSGSNSGNASFLTIKQSISEPVDYPSRILRLTSSTGLAEGMTIDCGGTKSGVLTGNSIQNLRENTIFLASSTIDRVNDKTICNFSFGFTNLAAPGSYKIVATAADRFDLIAPTGGHSQTDVHLIRGVVSFKDLVIPLMGVASAGDSWQIDASRPSTQNLLEFVDKANSIPNPLFEPGASGFYTTSTNPYPASGGTAGIYIATSRSSGGASGHRSFAVGDTSVASGDNSIALGGGRAQADYGVAIGPGVTSSGFGAHAYGHNVTAGGAFSYAAGEKTATSNSYSQARGSYATDGGRYSYDVFASGSFNENPGTAQWGGGILRGYGSDGSAIRLTSDGKLAGSANIVNLPASAIGSYGLRIYIHVLDTTSPDRAFSWTVSSAILTKSGNSNSTTRLTMGAPVILANSAFVPTISIKEDMINGGLNISVTPPKGNVNMIRAVARVESVEIQ